MEDSKFYSAAQKKKALGMIQQGIAYRDITAEIGVSKRTLSEWKRKFNEQDDKPEFVLPTLPSKSRTAEEIIAAKRVKFKRVKEYYDSRNLIDVSVNLDGPIAIAHFGDPHLDDDGTDIDLFMNHMKICKNTEGLFAGNVGDLTNNWVGKLNHLYAEQTTTKSEGWVLVEWMFEQIPWLYVIAGNHDCWSGGRDPVKWIAAKLQEPYVNHGTRLRLNLPSKEQFIINVAHDFKGHSQWNPLHGPMKKGKSGWQDDVFVCGHKHNVAYACLPSPITQKYQHYIRVDAYKRHDSYVKKLGIDETYGSPCVTTIFNPYAKTEESRISVVLDLEEAAEKLTWLRKRWK